MSHIYLVSDLHFGNSNESAVNIKVNQCISKIKDNIILHDNINIFNDEYIIIIAGDLTDHGYDGKETCKCLFKCFTSNSFFTGGGNINELNLFKTKFIEPLKNIKNNLHTDFDTPIKIFCGHGNHDLYNGAYKYPVLDYIKKEYSRCEKINYYFEFGSNKNIICFMCGLYPDDIICDWITKISNEKKFEITKSPVLICFHYPIKSNWWEDREKDKFMHTIKNINVIGVLTGHDHISRINTFIGEKNNFKEYNGSGEKIIHLGFKYNDLIMEEMI
jgi:calcineurin-like phosphoesterase family protein